MKVYITKHALTRGILKREVNTCHLATMIQDAIDLGTFYYRDEYRDEWHKTWEDAHAKAEAMRQKKIISLQKQIAKLGKLEFKREGTK